MKLAAVDINRFYPVPALGKLTLPTRPFGAEDVVDPTKWSGPRGLHRLHAHNLAVWHAIPDSSSAAYYHAELPKHGTPLDVNGKNQVGPFRRQDLTPPYGRSVASASASSGARFFRTTVWCDVNPAGAVLELARNDYAIALEVSSDGWRTALHRIRINSRVFMELFDGLEPSSVFPDKKLLTSAALYIAEDHFPGQRLQTRFARPKVPRDNALFRPTRRDDPLLNWQRHSASHSTSVAMVLLGGEIVADVHYVRDPFRVEDSVFLFVRPPHAKTPRLFGLKNLSLDIANAAMRSMPQPKAMF